MLTASMAVGDDPRVPENLVGLREVRLETTIDCDDPIARYVPLTNLNVREIILKLLAGAGIQEDRAVADPVLFVNTRLRFTTDPNLQLTYWSCRTETALRETLLRSQTQSPAVVDVWRHRANVGIFCGVIKPQDIGLHLQTEITRQIEAFVQDWKSVNEPHTVVGDVGKTDRVAKARTLLAAGTPYPQGSSGLVCDVLGIPFENANLLLGNDPLLVGDNNVYANLSPGDIVGWKSLPGEGHVAIFIGQAGGPKFIDVVRPNEVPRSVVAGYGAGRPIFRSSRF